MTDLLDLMGVPREEKRRVTSTAIKAAADHADRVTHEWTDKAYALLLDFMAGVKFFKSEDARLYAEGKGLPAPPDARAWGAVIKRAAKAGKITKIGFGVAESAKAHQRPATVWQTV